MQDNIFNRIRKYFVGEGGQSFVSWLGSGIPIHSKEKLMLEYKGLVHNAISAIADDLGRYTPILYQKREDEEKVLKSHPFMRLIERPNPTMSQYELFSTHAIDMELVGESFWYIVMGEYTKYPRQFYILEPQRMQVAINNETGDVVGYTMRLDNGEKRPFTPEEILHIKTPNPMNRYRGLGTLEAALLYVKTEQVQSLFQYNFIKNQATPSGVLTFKENINVDAFNKIKNKWQEQQSGTINAGKTLFLRGGDAKFEKIGLSLSDLDMGGLQKLTEDKVYRMFRVPRAILGETDSSGLGRSNIETIEYNFAKRTIDPKMDLLDDAFTMAMERFYKSRDKEKVYVKHVSQVPQDKEAILKEHVAGVGKWLTRNEIRKEKGLDPIDGGDELYVSFNEVSVSITPEPREKAVKIIKQQDNTQENEEAYFRVIEKIETKGQKKYKARMKELLKEQEARVIELVGAQTGKRFNQKAYDEAMPSDEETAVMFAEALLLVLLSMMYESGNTAVNYLAIADLEFIISQEIRDSIFNSTERLLKSFNKQTVEKLQKTLADGIAKNENVKEITKRIEGVYKEATGFRAERIAQTEAHKATNQAVAEAYKQAGIRKVKWQVTEPDPCPYCLAMNGKVVEVGTPFVPKGASIIADDGSEFIADYDDIKYADAHPNCKCQLVPIK